MVALHLARRWPAATGKSSCHWCVVQSRIGQGAHDGWLLAAWAALRRGADSPEVGTRCALPRTMRSLALRRRLGVLLSTVALTAGCVENADDVLSPDADEPEVGAELFRDFKDGKYDSAGHPLNAQVTEAEVLCRAVGRVSATAVALRTRCQGELLGPRRSGGLTANARMRVRSLPTGTTETDPVVATLRVFDPRGNALGETTLTATRLRGLNRWQDVSVGLTGSNEALTFEIAPAPGAEVVLDYIEVFPSQFNIVIGPGAGLFANTDRVTVELAKQALIRRVEIDGIDITARWRSLVTSRVVKRRDSEFRTTFDVAVGELAPGRGDAVQFRVFSNDGSVATTEVRQQVWPCKFEGAAVGKKILVTGFQPFPADGSHENVSAVAVQSARIAQLRGVRLMKVILPVEYDRAAATVQELIARCQPDAVVSFGQGGSSIELEQTAYNLKDASSFPDNRGIVLERAPIDAAAPADQATSLPLDAIAAALQRVGESPQRSNDPGRYICNNVFFTESRAIAARGTGQAGFIHLPYTTSFTATDRTRFGIVVEQVVNTIAAQ